MYNITSEASIATELTVSKFCCTLLTNRSIFIKNKGLGGTPASAIMARVTINPVYELLLHVKPE